MINSGKNEYLRKKTLDLNYQFLTHRSLAWQKIERLSDGGYMQDL